MTRPVASIRRGLRLGLLALSLALSLVGLGPDRAAAQPAQVQALLDQAEQAGADVAPMRTVAERATAAGLSSDATADLLRPAVDLARQDLPTGPVLNKALEGLAKRVPPARMMPVLQTLRGHTEQAGRTVSGWLGRDDVRTLVGASSDDAQPPGRAQLVTSIAEARQQGVSREAIDSFLDRLPAETSRRPVPLADVSTAVGVMPDVPSTRSSPQATHRLLTAALDAGYDASSLRRLPAALERAQRESQQPAVALAKGTAQAIAQGTPATRVLQNLFRGGPPGGGPPAGAGPPGNGPPGGNPPGKGPPDDPPSKGPPDDPPGKGPPDDPPGGGGGAGGSGGGG